ncbi:MAG: hypothetical protein ABGX25_02830 [Nautiliaceae bacterium]
MKIEQIELLNQIIGYESNINIAVTSKDLKEVLKRDERNIEIVDKDLNAKRFYHFIVMDKPFDIKALFRALRNGGYLISFIDLDDSELYDIGFSAISRMEGLLIAKKVHSWNDW